MIDKRTFEKEHIQSISTSKNKKIEDAILCAAKTAWLCAAMKTININQFERYDKTTAINDLLISEFPYTKFNKLKKTNQEAFFYWYKAINILFPINSQLLTFNS